MFKSEKFDVYALAAHNLETQNDVEIVLDNVEKSAIISALGF